MGRSEDPTSGVQPSKIRPLDIYLSNLQLTRRAFLGNGKWLLASFSLRWLSVRESVSGG